MEDDEIINSEADSNHPVLLIPRKCTMLETNCATADNVYIYLNITTQDTEGNEINVYTGICSVKILDNCNVEVIVNDRGESVDSVSSPEPMTVSGSQATFPDSHMWMNGAQSPHYNSYGAVESEERYSVYHQTDSRHITVEQHNTYITQNVYNYNEPVQFPTKDYDHNMFGRGDVFDKTQSSTDLSIDGEIECGTFLEKFPEEIVIENEDSARDGVKYVGMQSENEALNQLMSADIQSLSKQQMTILYVGHNSHYGQTIQNIAVNDPKVRCKESCVDQQFQTDPTDPNQKKYQCNRCKQIFDQMNSFKLHIQATHTDAATSPTATKPRLSEYVCYMCGKAMKTEKKYRTHVLGHGNPELECASCHKVFASKFTLRNHRKLHLKTHKCTYCSKSYYTSKELKAHLNKIHFVMNCDLCDFLTTNYAELSAHYGAHTRAEDIVRNDSETTLSLDEDWIAKTAPLLAPTPAPLPAPISAPLTSPLSTPITDPLPAPLPATLRAHLPALLPAPLPALLPAPLPALLPAPVEDFAIQTGYDNLDVKDMEPDAVIAKVMSNKVFLLHSKKAKKHRNRKICNVCHKTFDRVSDLKRHLIEHVIRSTLAKVPVENSALCLKCEVCQQMTFTRIDKYKAHLREHAKLTLYKCIFCDKSFSDSSNFSKHKKIHGTTYFQCDMCLRKFNSKKTLTRHMEYHNTNAPLLCCFCDKQFHFPSMLKKHVKLVHHRVVMRTKCRFCQMYFDSLKDKWDHDWLVHNVRKLIVDCLICESKFRKYTELKYHCKHAHGTKIPPAKKLLKKHRRVAL